MKTKVVNKTNTKSLSQIILGKYNLLKLIDID